MKQGERIKIALIGNPNSGKSSVFNQLTGLRQKIGNFPGVTVEKKLGIARLDGLTEATIIDFPGTYSLFPTAKDERVVLSTFVNPGDENYPDLVLYVADVTNLERQLLLFTQLLDLGLPIILVLNMKDVAERDGLYYDTALLQDKMNVPVVAVSSRSGENFEELRRIILREMETGSVNYQAKPFYQFSIQEQNMANRAAQVRETQTPYQAKLIGHHFRWLPFLDSAQRADLEQAVNDTGFEDLRMQIRETMQRYDSFVPIVRKVLRKTALKDAGVTDRIDNVVVHPFWGPLIFFGIMVMVFQAIYTWSSYPMDMIESLFGFAGEQVRSVFGRSMVTDLLTDGILAGLGGILVFVPQIAILFFLISLLEEVGYMARAVFMFDRVMQKFGLNGRSIVALVSGGACAIPAIMSTRTIGNWKERIITIMVTPLISCSARIPVYTVLIGFVVPSVTIAGIFNLQGLAFMGLYLLGIIAAFAMALVFKLILKSEESSYLMIELPEYRSPVMRNVLLTMWEKVKAFVVEAGKIIMIISVILWFLASFGPGSEMEIARESAIGEALEQGLGPDQTADLVASREIRQSYAGHLGRFLEPVIAPLGFDWKIGIALVTSFAAREVFIGTMATLYSIGSEDDELKIRQRMAAEIDDRTGRPVYSMATSLSLLIFYVFAMQCMSTLAVVRRETRSWKWPLLQFGYMSALAYLGSLFVYQLFS